MCTMDKFGEQFLEETHVVPRLAVNNQIALAAYFTKCRSKSYGQQEACRLQSWP